MNQSVWVVIIMLSLSCIFSGISNMMQDDKIEQLQTRIERLEK